MRGELNLLSLYESPPPPPVLPPSAAPPWTELPSDVTANILQRLGAVKILESAQLVCTTWWKVCQDPVMWHVIKIEFLDFNLDVLTHRNFNNACRRAVDRSKGQLVDLNITYVYDGDDVDDEVLHYLLKRSPNLRRLSLKSYYGVSRAALVEAVKKLPELEEFHLLSYLTLNSANIKTIGRSCPSLNSFALFLGRAPISHNENVVAISKFMPRLQHLRLHGYYFDNTGLEAILDGCPQLESLDLRLCFNIDLGGALGKRCRDQIKDLMIPSHSSDDDVYRQYEYLRRLQLNFSTIRWRLV